MEERWLDKEKTGGEEVWRGRREEKE